MSCWARIWKRYCHIWNQHPPICLITKFCKKTKMPKSGNKSALLCARIVQKVSFWAKIWKNYCHIWNQHPRIFLITKLGKGPKLPYSGTFGLEFEKANVISEMSTPGFLKDESLTHKVNFGIVSDFSKGLRSPFSEGSGPGSGSHCKVCQCTLLPIIFFSSLSKLLPPIKRPSIVPTVFWRPTTEPQPLIRVSSSGYHWFYRKF